MSCKNGIQLNSTKGSSSSKDKTSESQTQGRKEKIHFPDFSVVLLYFHLKLPFMSICICVIGAVDVCSRRVLWSPVHELDLFVLFTRSLRSAAIHVFGSSGVCGCSPKLWKICGMPAGPIHIWVSFSHLVSATWVPSYLEGFSRNPFPAHLGARPLLFGVLVAFIVFPLHAE